MLILVQTLNYLTKTVFSIKKIYIYMYIYIYIFDTSKYIENPSRSTKTMKKNPIFSNGVVEKLHQSIVTQYIHKKIRNSVFGRAIHAHSLSIILSSLFSFANKIFFLVCNEDIFQLKLGIYNSEEHYFGIMPTDKLYFFRGVLQFATGPHSPV